MVAGNIDRGRYRMAPSTGRRRPAGALGLIGVILAAAVATACSSGSAKSSDPSVPADQDVTVTSCAPSDDQSEGYLAKISVVNHSAQAADYLVTVAFVGPDGAQELDRAAVAIAKIDPGQTVDDETASAKADLRSTAGVTCKITSAFRSVAG